MSAEASLASAHDTMAGRDKPQLSTDQLPYQRLSRELLPPGLRLMVIHNQVAAPKHPADAECVDLAIDAAAKHDSHVTERSIADEDWLSIDDVVDRLVQDKNLNRVGSHV